MNNPLVFFLNSEGVVLFVFGALLFLYIKEGFSEVFKHTFYVAFVTLFVTILLKELFNTPRPFVIDMSTPEAGLTFFPSFPSSHAAISFSVATIVSLHRRKFGVFLFVLATLLSVGRVAANVHYPTDVIFGILVGVTVALFFDTFHVRREKRY